MSRRTREVCSISSITGGDLGNQQNWLTALDTHSIAVANRSTVMITDLDRPNHEVVKIRPDLSPIESESVSALEWLVFGSHTRALAVGTSAGFLLVYSLYGVLIHRQIVHPGRILKLRVRGTNRDLIQDASAEEICVVMPGVIARFDGSHIQTLLNRWFRETSSQFVDESGEGFYGNAHGRLPYQLWNVSKYGTCADAAITGLMPPPLMELQSSQRYYCAVTIGNDAVISAFRLSEDRGRSLVGAILSKVVPVTFSTISSFSKLIWRSDPKAVKKPEAKPQPFARASPLTCLKDHPRKGEKLTLSPSGTMAAITDSLGRILLLDTQALVVVRLWKGYREASCLFMEMLMNKDATTSSSAYYDNVKGDYCLCLAIHAPRKGIIEGILIRILSSIKEEAYSFFGKNMKFVIQGQVIWVWQMRTGVRLLTIPCARGSKILQPTYRFESSSSSSHSYVPLEVFILNGDSGQLSVINRSLK